MRTVNATARQLDLFAAVGHAFGASPERLPNADLYRVIEQRTDLDLSRKQPMGRHGAEHSPGKRAVRWVQQTLKHLGLIERMPQERGVWRVTPSGRAQLTPAAAGQA